MKITMYELLGMVKDGKAPNKIKYDGMIWEYDGDFYSSEHGLILDEYCNLSVSLNDEVEIIEEEKEIPEKIPLNYADDRKPEEVYEYLRCSYNQLIDYLKEKENK